jgi:hypothetical protein
MNLNNILLYLKIILKFEFELYIIIFKIILKFEFELYIIIFKIILKFELIKKEFS